MPHRVLVLQHLVALIVLTWAVPACAEDFTGKVIGVSDGDTITVLRGEESLIREVRFRVFEGLEPLHDTVAVTVKQLEPDLHATLDQGATELAKDVARSLGGPS
jgi:hypothetical protein